VGADYKAFPGSIVNFEPGRVYCFIFDGNVALIAEIELTLENTAGIIHTGPGLYRGDVKIGEQNLQDSLAYISANAANNDKFYIVLGGDESSAPLSLNYSGRTVGITLLGYGGKRTISLNSNGSLFTVNSGVTLTLDDNITLTGRNANTSALVTLNDGKLIVNAGAKIAGNTASTTAAGGGVFITGTNAVFTMNGGEITGNTAAGYDNGRGGGVYVNSGTFTMNGGEISGNTATSYGGGVAVISNTSFFKTGGTIYGYVAGDNRSNIVKNNSGVVQNNMGHTVYATNSNSSYIKRKETIAGPTVNLSSNSSSWSGAWDY